MSLLSDVATRLIPKPWLHRILAHRAITRGHNPELALLPSFNNGGMFVDIGANIGDYSRVAALHFRDVVVFEPQAALVAKLRRELPNNTRIFHCALSDTVGRRPLYIPVSVDGRETRVTGLASLSATSNEAELQALEMVDVSTLDSYELHGVDLIKIDVEGFELNVLRGGIETLKREEPVLIVEIEDRHHPGQTLPVFQFLWDLGYDTAHFDGQSVNRLPSDETILGHIGGAINNFIFMPCADGP